MRSDRYNDTTIEDSYEAMNEAVALESAADVDLPESDGSRKRKGMFDRKKTGHDDNSKLLRLKKKELLEIMLAQSKEIDSLRERIAELEAALADREFDFSRIGSIAEASLAVTNIFKEAEEAAKVYLDNVRRRSEQAQ